MKPALTLLVLIIAVATVSTQQFNPGCQFGGQLRTLNHRQGIDNRCVRDGEGSSDSNAQNHAKNNFCAANQRLRLASNYCEISR